MKFTLIFASIAVLSSFVLAMPIGQEIGARDITDFDPILQEREYSALDARDYLDVDDLLERGYTALDARDYLDVDDLLERELDDELDIAAREPMPHSMKCLSRCMGLRKEVVSRCLANCH